MGALAPMVDMMTLLLVFLLRSYATEPVPHPPDGAFVLPGTTSEDPTRPAIEVLVSNEAVWIDGRRVVATRYLPQDAVIREIYDPLLAIRGRARVELHADRAVPWSVLARVLQTARAAGYEDIALVAANRASL